MEEEKTFAEEIEILVKDIANNNPAPEKCTITKNYSNPNYVDVETNDGTEYKTIPLLGSNKINTNGIVLFLDGNGDNPIVITSIAERFGFNQLNAEKFNFAVITKIENNIEYQEFWILSNAYYDYDDKYFHKIDLHNTSFAIQIQGKGSYPGEAELGYYDNSGINIWRNASIENLAGVSDEQKRCLVEKGIIGEYDANNNIKTFSVLCGWNNSFMFDSYGGMTIGGAGFEIDGNGIYPYTRIANCLYTDKNENEYGYIALLHNAYNSTRYGWDCDNNRTYSWLMGIHAPIDENLGGNNLDLSQADFRVMYNDTPHNEENIHELDMKKWHTIFKVDLDSTMCMVDGQLSMIGHDSGWITATNLNPIFMNYNTPVYYKKVNNNIVHIGGAVTCVSDLASNSEFEIFNLPSGFRPSKDLSVLCELENEIDSLWTCTIKTNGDVCFHRLRDSDGPRTMIANTDILKFDITFLI